MSHPTATPGRPLVHLGDLLRELVNRDLKARYKRSVLGIAWSLLVPLAQLLVLYFVFHYALPLSVPHYTSFLITGILPWSWFHASLSSATVSVVENRELTSQPGFPVTLLPVASVTSQGLHFLLGIPIVVVLLGIDGYGFSPALLSLPLIVALQFVFTVGLAYFAAALHVLFEDTRYLLGIALMLLFYVTPIFYDPAIVPEQYRSLLMLNPMAVLLVIYRSVLLEGELPAAWAWFSMTAVSVVIFGAGYLTFWRTRFRFAEDL
ncbi:MAG: ABC transporter permease [Pseudomonadota bacterium]